jgi:hypothetical protein
MDYKLFYFSVQIIFEIFLAQINIKLEEPEVLERMSTFQPGENRILQVKEIRGDSKLLLGFPWTIIFKPKVTK